MNRLDGNMKRKLEVKFKVWEAVKGILDNAVKEVLEVNVDQLDLPSDTHKHLAEHELNQIAKKLYKVLSIGG